MGELGVARCARQPGDPQSRARSDHPVGEAGLVGSPALWHFPRYGCLQVEAHGDVLLRSDSVRPLDTNTFEIKVAEQPTEPATTGSPPAPPRRRHAHGGRRRTWRRSARTHRRRSAAWSSATRSPPCRIAPTPRRSRQRRVDALHHLAQRRVGDRRAARPSPGQIPPDGARRRLARAVAARRPVVRERAHLARAPPARGPVRPPRRRHALALSRYLRWAPDSAFFDANAGTIDGVIDQMWRATSTTTGWSSRRSASATRASTSGHGVVRRAVVRLEGRMGQRRPPQGLDGPDRRAPAPGRERLASESRPSTVCWCRPTSRRSSTP